MIGKHQFTLIAERTIAGTDGYNSREVTSNYHKGALIVIDRQSETGTATLDAVVEHKNSTTGAWNQLEGASFHQFADGETGERYLMIYPGLVGSDADSHVELDTDKGNLCGQYLPRVWRLALTTAGTTNVVSVNVTLLP